MALGAERQIADLTAVHERQERIGYPSDLIVGEREVRDYMTGLFPDWRAQGVTSACTSTRAGSRTHGLAARAGREGARGRARISTASASPGSSPTRSGAVTAVQTDQGDDRGRAGHRRSRPVGRDGVGMLGLPSGSTCARRRRRPCRPADVDVWYLQEGEIDVDPKLLSLEDGSMPPVLHVDSDAPLYDDEGKLITDEFWGNYFKQDLQRRAGRRGAGRGRQRVHGRPVSRPRPSSRRSPTCGAPACPTA